MYHNAFSDNSVERIKQMATPRVWIYIALLYVAAFGVKNKWNDKYS